MFSANENIVLRQHKRRIIQQVEECIARDVLDLGTTVMVMQVSCRAPGCVPLETLILIVFPTTTGNAELLPGLKESASGGTYKTKVLKPMADVTKQDVLEALPPSFKGGLRSTERLCFQARDVMLAQITQLIGEEDQEGRQLMAEYLQECLQEYMKRDCVPPEFGKPFSDKTTAAAVDTKQREISGPESSTGTAKLPLAASTGNFIVRRAQDDGDDTAPPFMTTTSIITSSNTQVAASKATAASSWPSTTTTTTTPSTMDWRRQQGVEKVFQSQSIIERLSEREHASGVRMAGCPCCDPDNPSNYVDSMMML